VARIFQIAKVSPGRVVTALLGEIDFSIDSIQMEKLKQLYKNDFPYLKIKNEGKRELYGF